MIHDPKPGEIVEFMRIVSILTIALGLHLASLFTAAAQAQEDGLDTAKKASDTFISLWCSPYTNGLLSQLIKGSWYKPEEADDIATQTESERQKLTTAQDRTDGDHLAVPYEFLGSKRLGLSTAKLVYLEKYKRNIIPWTFAFYKARQDWKIAAIQEGDLAKDDVLSMAVDASTNAEQPLKIADSFMKELTSGNESNAWSALVLTYWAKPQDAASTAERIASTYRSKRALAELNLGNQLPGSFERLSVKRIGRSLLNIVYVERHVWGCLPLKLMFYKPQNDWKLCEAGFADAVSTEEVRESMAVSPADPAHLVIGGTSSARP